MNIFASADSFLGEIQSERLGQSISEIFDISAGIREKLGSNQSLLSEYLETVLDAISITSIETPATLGFSNCTKELRTVCHDIIGCYNKYSQHPFYPIAKHYINAHPLQCSDEQSKLEIYTVALIGCFNKYAVGKYYEKFKSKIESKGHISRLTMLYDEICRIFGTEAEMDKLNETIRECFVAIPVMTSFAQGIADNAVLSLLYKEPSSNTYVFDMPIEIEA